MNDPRILTVELDDYVSYDDYAKLLAANRALVEAIGAAPDPYKYPDVKKFCAAYKTWLDVRSAAISENEVKP